jgi:hypothetical protein
MWSRSRTARAVAEAEAIALIQAGGSGQGANLSNWLSLWTRTGAGGGTPSSQTAPLATIVAAGAIEAKYTGLFQVIGNVKFYSGTINDTITPALYAQQSAGAGVLAGLAGATVAAHGMQGALASNASSVVLTSDAAGGGGIGLDGTAFSAGGVVLVSGSAQLQQATTAGVEYEYSFNGIFGQAASGAKTPWMIGDTVAFGIGLTGTDVANIRQVNLSITEWPFG